MQTTKSKQDCSEYVLLKVSEGLTEEIFDGEPDAY